jgi:hypothetical protein
MGKNKKELLKSMKLQNDQFRVLRDNVPFSTERVVVIKGEDDALTLLLQYIVNKIKSVGLITDAILAFIIIAAG